MKYITAIFFLIWTCLVAKGADQPEYGRPVFERDDNPIQGLQFVFSLDTNTLVTGSTNVIQFRIINNSTNVILFAEATMAVYLTNDFQNAYTLLAPPDPNAPHPFQLAPSVPSIDVLPIGVGSNIEWSASLPISENIVPGSYRLVAADFFGKRETMSGRPLQYGSNVQVI